MNQRSYTEELVTPEIARSYLVQNTHNRSTKPRRIQEYAESMIGGMWLPNGEAIKFDTTGRLIDGQNRLHAVIEANTPITMLVARGLEPVSQETMDTGAKRSLPDALKLRGETNCNSLAATIRSCYYWDARTENNRVFLGASGQPSCSNSMLLAYFDKDPDSLRELNKECDRLRSARRCQIPNSVSAPLIRIMQEIDPEDYEAFSAHLRSGTPARSDLAENDPVFRFMTAMDARREQRGWHNPTEIGALFIKSWNGFRDGVPIKTMRWRQGGASPEAFPEAI